MDQIKHRALTYSLLAHIRNKGQLSSGPLQIFLPLIKRTLSKMNEKATFSGKSIMEIKVEADEMYGIDFPIPVMRSILTLIAKEINTVAEKNFFLFQDDSFQIKNYAFVEFEETVRIHKVELAQLDKLFVEFCDTCSASKPDDISLLVFIEKNKLALSKYLSHKLVPNGHDFTIEAQFVEFFKKVPPVYEIIRKIYLGSILSSYIEYKPHIAKTNVELVLDTNFILGFLDLNTPESTHTCKKIIEIAQSQGYAITVLNDTLNETTFLLQAKAQNFDLTFLQRKIYPEDIYNACERRGLSQADIERIADNLNDTISQFGIHIVSDTKKYKNLAVHSNEFETLKKYRNNYNSALHDATALYYVREKRKKKIKEFENVNCWFINNAVNRDKYSDVQRNNPEYQPELIKADDFLNVIWLSNPQIANSLELSEVADIGLTSLISLGLTDSLPKLSIIRELDDNIHKYASDKGLNDTDILRIATRITTKQLSDLDNLNKLAVEDKEGFVQRLSEEAKKQKELEDERIKKLDQIVQEFKGKSEILGKIKTDYEIKSKQVDEKLNILTGEFSSKVEKIDELQKNILEEKQKRKRAENKLIQEKREFYIDSQVALWQKKTNNELIVWLFAFALTILWFFYTSNWDLDTAKQLYEGYKGNIIFSSIMVILGFVFSSITAKKWYDKNYNHSNIENYKKGLKIPEKLRDLE